MEELFINSPEPELDQLLENIERQIDPAHCRRVDERYRSALSWRDVSQPPLVVRAPYPTSMKLPSPWAKFRRYTYRQAFYSPAAMLQNELLSFVVPGVLIRDDSPLAIRNNHGTIQIASLLGGEWELPENDFPWIRHFESVEGVSDIVADDSSPSPNGGVLTASIETLDYYSHKLNAYPRCKEVIQIAMPDMQGPLDTAEQLWGSDIYYALADDADLFGKLLSRIVDVMLFAEKQFRSRTMDRLDPVANTQHGYEIPGRLLIRNDSSIMLSREMYEAFVRSHDARVLQQVGSGSIHFCGNGQHLIEKMLGIPDLKGIDLGQPELMDVNTIYAMCREQHAAVTNLNPAREDLVSGKATHDFPTGCVLAYLTNDIDDAREVIRAYGS